MSPTTRRIIVGFGIAGMLVVAGLLLLGLPGGFILDVVNRLFGGPNGLPAFKGDRAWPAAIVVASFCRPSDWRSFRLMPRLAAHFSGAYWDTFWRGSWL